MIQIDDPWLRNDPDAAKRIAVRALDRALAGLKVPTVVHLCFGYGAVVPRTSRSAIRSCRSSPDSTADQISIEAAQPKLDLGILKDLAGKTIVLGVIDLGDETVETPRGGGAAASARALKFIDAKRLVPGARLRDEISFARDRVRQAAGAERRRRDGAPGTDLGSGGC